MKAMVLRQPAPVESAPLGLDEWPLPEPGPREVRIRVRALRRANMRPGCIPQLTRFEPRPRQIGVFARAARP